MSNEISPIEKWELLIGKWQSLPETQIGDPMGYINKAEITANPSNKYINMINHSIQNDQIVSTGISYLFYDESIKKFKMKSFYPAGFVINYEEMRYNDNEMHLFAAAIDSLPIDFFGTRWRYSLEKEDDDKFTIYLEMSKDEGEYEIYWQATYIRA